MECKLRNPLTNLATEYGTIVDPVIKADANEAYYTLLPETFELKGEDFSKYPDSDATTLRKELSKYYDIGEENLLLSNGSSQILEMLLWSYCQPGDVVLSFRPGFVMYQNYVDKSGAKLVWVPTVDFVQDMNVLREYIQEYQPKLILLCNPGNPTGYVNTKEEIYDLVEEYPNTLVVVDEAYGDFSNESVIQGVKKYKNLLVTKTFSKAWGLANLRLGYVAGIEEWIQEFWKIKLPYNISGATLAIAEKVFPKGIEKLPEYIAEVKETRSVLENGLRKLGYRMYTSHGNFVFGRPPVEGIKEELEKRGIYIRQFLLDGVNYHRITIVSPEDTKQLLKNIEEVIREKGKN